LAPEGAFSRWSRPCYSSACWCSSGSEPEILAKLTRCPSSRRRGGYRRVPESCRITPGEKRRW